MFVFLFLLHNVYLKNKSIVYDYLPYIGEHFKSGNNINRSYENISKI